jgi:branched-chain amino acid transport system substrate-binding protein
MKGGAPRMNRLVRRSLAIVCALTLASTVAACSDDGSSPGTGNTDAPSEPQPGVTDTEILIGSHQPLTGPAAPGYSKIAPAAQAFFNYVNDKGGVHGRKITYKFVDDGYNPANTQTVVRELVLQDKVFAVFNGLGTPTHSGVLDFLKSNRVPDLFVASGALAWNQPEKYPYTFGWQTDYTIEGKILADYVKKNFAGQKVCHFGQNDDFGRDHLAGVEKVLGANGLATKQNYVPTNTNVAPQLNEMKTAGCQVVVLATVPGFTAATLGAAARIAFKPQFVASSVSGDYRTLVGRLGEAGKPLLEGLLGAGYLPSVDENDNPWIKLFKDINTKFNNNAEFDGNVLYGMSVAYTFTEALQKAGKNLTRQGIVEAIEKGGFKGPGLVPLQYAKGNHAGYSGVRMGKVTSGVQLGFGPVFQTDVAAGEVKEYTNPPTTPPSSGLPEA